MDYSEPCNNKWYGCLDYQEIKDGQNRSMVIAWTATRPRQLTAREAGRRWNSGVYERGSLDKSRGRGREGIGVRPVAPWLLHGC